MHTVDIITIQFSIIVGFYMSFFNFHEFYQLSLVNQGILEKCNI